MFKLKGIGEKMRLIFQVKPKISNANHWYTISSSPHLQFSRCSIFAVAATNRSAFKKLFVKSKMQAPLSIQRFKHLVEIGPGFWNIRSSFTFLMGLVDIGTHM